MQFISASPEDTMKIAGGLARDFKGGETVLLTGDLGAGKTVFTKGLARALGVKEEILSPTFTIVREYQGRLPLKHFDLYRIEDADELAEIGFEEYFDDKNVCVIEWPEIAAPLILENVIRVYLSGTGDERTITVEL